MRSLPALVTTLGIAQIISWGTLFYAIGVLGKPMARDLGASELFLFSSFTAGLLVSGTLAPLAGRFIDRRGGGFVLSIGSALAAIAMALLAIAPNAWVMVLGWLTAGAAMAACLYDPAFATLAQLTGPRYRKAVTALTLFGGFASTVFWPASHLLLESIGWRDAFWVYAALHLAVCLPIHRLVAGARTETGDRPRLEEADATRRGPSPISPAFSDPRLFWLASAFAIATFIFGVIAVHLVNLLTEAGLTAAQAVTISMLVGPMQVAGRIIELTVGQRVRAVTVGVTTFVLMFLAIVALMTVDGFGVMPVLFVIAYGCGNGVLTIVRGTAPIELFGPQGVGGLLGYLSRWILYAKAIAPAAFTGLVAAGLTRNAALGVLAALAVLGMWTYLMAARPR